MSTMEGTAPGDHFIAATPIDDPTPDPDVPVSYVTLSQSELSLSVGSYKRLEYTVFPTNATNQTVSWSSSDPRVATVENGMVHAIAAGMARITVKTQDGGYTAECVITVNGNLEGEALLILKKESCPFKKWQMRPLTKSVNIGWFQAKRYWRKRMYWTKTEICSASSLT